MDKPRKLYIDMHSCEQEVKVDDFLVAIGKKKSNSVYHIAEIRSIVPQKNGFNRYYITVFKTELATALKRDSSQNIIPISWNPRNKK